MDNDGHADDETRIEVKPDGPLIVTGRFTIVDADGRPLEVTDGRAKLCRCGRSETKPFCDGGHKRTGWQAAAEHLGETGG